MLLPRLSPASQRMEPRKGRTPPVAALRRRSASRRQTSSCARAQRAGSAQGTVPSALPGSTAMAGCFWHQPHALTCDHRRGQPASTGRGEPPEAVNTRLWPAVMTPRLAGLRADDAVASHRAADGAGPPIAGARTCAGGTPRGAVARFRAFPSAHRKISIALFSRPRPTTISGIMIAT